MRVNKLVGGNYHVESICGDVWTSIDHKLTNGPDIVNIALCSRISVLSLALAPRLAHQHRCTSWVASSSRSPVQLMSRGGRTGKPPLMQALSGLWQSEV